MFLQVFVVGFASIREDVQKSALTASDRGVELFGEDRREVEVGPFRMFAHDNVSI